MRTFQRMLLIALIGAAVTAIATAIALAAIDDSGIRCNDGTTWAGTTRQGACSGHGGINE